MALRATYTLFGTLQQGVDWLGQTLDLKSAYKQFPIKPEATWAALLAANDPESGELHYFQSLALLFGSTSSASYVFNRIAFAL